MELDDLVFLLEFCSGCGVGLGMGLGEALLKVLFFLGWLGLIMVDMVGSNSTALEAFMLNNHLSSFDSAVPCSKHPTNWKRQALEDSQVLSGLGGF